ncbi:TonB-dependent receptor domain-containing protein [Roseateles oligotrophus]|uniref:TonB-dependent receptor n=1 Tax=Roseateles oligotrophus TaxID=1769250 RepID=A0ABT2YK17_9BURK|nr:TonB-dependent receptor [Roseateles oligotrophus]MCV2370395.1 TonB-dependent receptor [Roseateles oligotrophus]
MKFLTTNGSKSFKIPLRVLPRDVSAALAAWSVLLLTVPAASYAEENQEAQVSAAQAKDAKAPAEGAIRSLDTVMVTGSHIPGMANATSSAPITQVGEHLIRGTASISIEDSLSRIPSITSSNSASSNNNSTGAEAANVGVATVSLRNLGSARTLVLVNGRRFVSGVSANTGYGVDLNSIPTALVKRVDVLTGGQSAIYGSDAIAGVINIITKTNFSGLEINAFGADSQAGGGGRKNVDLTYGQNFSSGNAWVSAGRSVQEALHSPDRPFSSYELAFVDGNKSGVLDTITRRPGPAHVPGGALFVGPNGNNLAIFGSGAPFNRNQPLLDANFKPTSNADWDNQYARRYLVTPYQRNYVASGMTFDLSPDSRADVELNWTKTSASVGLEPAPLSAVADVFRVPQGGRTGIDVATSPYFVGSSAGRQLVTALGADTSLDRVQTFRRLAEFGDRTASSERNTFRIATGLTHDFSDTMSLKTSVIYGQTSATQTNTGDISIPNFRNALTIVPNGRGGYQCADAVARIEGCRPVNPFGTVDSLAGQAGITGISPEAIKYLKIATGGTGKVSQTVVNTVLSGQAPWSISGKPISYATGLEYRKEEGAETPDSYRQQGLSRDLQVSAISGQFDVKEAFAEIEAPLARWLILDAAARVGKYSTIGTASTYRLGLNAPVMDALRMRGSWSRSMRAPNVNDLFSNGTTTAISTTTTDVCNGVTATTPGNIAQNCRSIPAVAKRIADVGVFKLVASEANNTRLLSLGSQTLGAETADAVTLGMVFTPLRGLSLSVDYFDISIKDGITRISPDVFVKSCHDVAPGSFDATCGGKLTRDVNEGPMLNLSSPLINAASIKTKGVDLELNYSQRNFGITAFANYLENYDVVSASGATENFGGRPLYPKWRLTLNGSYKISDQLDVFAQARYRSATQEFLTKSPYSEDLNNVKSSTYTDLRFNYSVTPALSLYVGANNLFDVQPDILPRGGLVGTNTEPRAFDVIGRQFFAGLKFKLK